MKILGLILIGLGVASIGGGGITPNNFSGLLERYKKAKLEGREPALDEKWAYSNHAAHKIGAYLIIIGVFIWVVGFLIQAN